MINKPAQLGQFQLLVVRGLNDVPVTPLNAINMTYSSSILASNSFDNKVLVYVTALNIQGINDYKAAFPNAEIIGDAIFDGGDKWKVLAFPSENAGERILDIYYKARISEIKEDMIKAKLKKEDKTK